MGTVKYSGPIASFHCPTEATIRSLKVHFSPKQEGSGDPSPENVRAIVGWEGVEVSQHGRNLYNKDNVIPHTADDEWNCIMAGAKQKIAVSAWPCWTFIAPAIPNATYYWIASCYEVGFLDKDKNVLTYKSGWNNTNVEAPTNAIYVYHTWIKNESLNQEQLDAAFKTYDLYCDTMPTAFEPQKSKTTNYEFGVLGKNKFNWDVPVSESSPVGSDAATAREFTLDTYVIGMSVNNYYRQNYAKWVLNPSVENGVISFSSGGASGYGIAFPLKLVVGQAYFLSGTGNGVAGVTYYNEDGELISYQNDRLNKIITVPENAVTTLIGFYANTSNTDFTFSNIQLELGSTATTYEPYDPKHTVYGGWVDLITGEVCETHTKYVFTGEEGFHIENSYQNKPFVISRNSQYYANMAFAGSSNTNIVCNKLKGVSARFHYLNDGCICTSTSSVYSYILMNGKEIFGETNEECNQTLADWYANGTPLEMIAPLREAYYKTYSLAPTQLQTFLGQNNVWSNADYVEVEYDLHETQNILAHKQFIMANQPHIVKPAAAPLQNFVTDMKAPLKECKVYFSPVQDTSNGVPSPDNICPISGWTGVNVYKAGENLIPIDYAPVEGKWKPTNGVISGSVYNMGQFPVPASLIYYQVETTGNPYFGFIDGTIQNGEPTYNVATVTNVRNKGFDNTAGHKYALITATNETVYANKIVISVGQGVKPYSEPSGTTIPIDWTTEIGTVYGGYVDLISGELVQEYYKITLDGVTTYCKVNSDYSNDTYIAGGVVYLTPRGTYDKQSGVSRLFCDKLPVITRSATKPEVPFLFTVSAGDQYVQLVLARTADHPELDTAQKRIDFCNTWLAEKPIDVVYPLKTPITHTLTPQQLSTLRGTNNIWSNSNGDITVQFWKH